MRIRNRVGLGLLVTGVTAIMATPANAQWSAIQQTLFRDLNYGLNPDVISSPQGGPLFNFNDFFQRVEYDRVSQGYAYEFYRFFGPDSFGESNVVDLGVFKLNLEPDADLNQSQFTGIHGRAGFSTRTIPEINFLAETGQRSFNQFSGIASFSKEPLKYTASLNTGVQDFEWTGNMSIDASGTINLLGFYDFNMQLVNVGNFTADGVLIKDEQVTDFDTGPIDLSGHIGMDVIASLFQANGTDGAAAVPRIFSAAAGKDRTADELVTAMKQGEKLTNEEVEFLIEQMFVQAFINDPIGFIMNGPPTTFPGFEELGIELQPANSIGTSSGSPDYEQTPEPGTLVLFGGSIALALFIRKRGGFERLAFPPAM